MNVGENSATELTGRVAPEDVRAQLARILGDPSFVAAPQLGRLLQHLVENALSGELREVKEYALGMELFGRGASFDPKIDTVVRAAARRLRQRLDEYFEGPGRADPVIIEVPKGHYLAVFRSRPEGGTSDAAQLGTPSRRASKAVAAAIVATLVLSAAGGWWFWNRAEQVATTPSILVLPFQNLNDSSDTNNFAGGVHEDLLTLLSRIKGLDVIARSTAVSLAAANKTVKEMAADAGVDHVLEGSIRRTPDRIRLTVQLIAAADERHLWADTYDREGADIFAIQSELAQSIAEQLRIRLDPAVVQGFAKGRTTSIEAYELVLRTRSPQLANPGSLNMQKANLERAIELDPNYADAYAELATQAFWGWSNDDEVKSRFKQNIDKALSIDPQNARALTAMGYFLVQQGRPDLGSEYWKQALAADPSDSDVQWLYASGIADYRERRRHVEEAYRLNPLGLNSGSYVDLLLQRGRVAEALAVARRSAAFAPESVGAIETLARVYGFQGDSIAALRQWRRSFELSNDATPMVDALSAMGQVPAAMRWLEATKPGPFWTARVLLHAGNTDGLEDLLTQWLAESPHSSEALTFNAFLEARRGDEAFDRGDIVGQRTHLERSLAAFRAEPLADDAPGFQWSDLSLVGARVRWLTVARQAGDEQLAAQLEARLNEILTGQAAPEELRFERGMMAALARDRTRALEEFEHAIVPGQWLLWALDTYGVLQNRAGIFHGIASEPRFRELVAGERRRLAELNDKITVEAPDLLEPPQPSASK